MQSTLLAMAIFAFTMSISPGPVNMVIVASGAQHGVWRTLPFVSGATLGFTALLTLIGFGLMQVFAAQPWVLVVLGWSGAAFIVYLGCRIAMSVPELDRAAGAAPGFWQGALLQWLNPKAWIACAAGVAMFASADSMAPLLWFLAIYFSICYAALAAWAVLGERVGRWLNSRARWRVFNGLMGASLVATAIYMLP